MVQPRILFDTKAISPANILTIPGSTVDLKRGDLLSFESAAAVLMDGAAEDVTFCGAALNQYTSGNRQPQQVMAAMVCMIEIDATSAAYALFDGLTYTSKNTLVDDGGANTMAWCGRKTGTATRIQAYINVPALGKLFAVSA